MTSEKETFDLSVVIVNYNVEYFLEQCLNSVREASEECRTEIFVVDNNSNDGSVEMVREKFPEVKLILNKENKGFSKANNQAIKEAEGRYILLLNPDTVVEELTFKKITAFMKNTPKCGGLGVRMVDGKGDFLPESKRGLPTPKVAFYKIFGLSAIFPKSKEFGAYHLGFLNEFETNEIDVLSGAFLCVSREAIEKIGLLDETFFMYAEDIDWCYRIKQAGWKVWYHAAVTVYHVKRAASSQSSKAQFEFWRAMLIFYRKHYRATTPFWLHGLVMTGLLVKGGSGLWQEIRQPSTPLTQSWIPATPSACSR